MKTEADAFPQSPPLTYQILRYNASLIRDEWVNIGVLLFEPGSGELRLRIIEEQKEFARIRRLHPLVDEQAIAQLRDHLEERFQQEKTAGLPGEVLLKVVEKWNATLSNTIQLAPQRGVYAADLDTELARLYAEQVTAPEPDGRPGSLHSRPGMRHYCAQVWRQARLWHLVQKSIRMEEFTFPGDPTRIDFGYRRNGTRGFVQMLSVTRAPGDCTKFAYNADHIAKRAPFQSEFLAVTDVALQSENQMHGFVNSALREAGIETIPLENFAVWVAKLRPLLN